LIVFPRTGWTRSGAISARGLRTEDLRLKKRRKIKKAVERFEIKLRLSEE
jgi:hypothetical protein